MADAAEERQRPHALSLPALYWALLNCWLQVLRASRRKDPTQRRTPKRQAGDAKIAFSCSMVDATVG